MSHSIPFLRGIRCVGHAANMGRKFLVGKPEGKTPLGEPRRGREDNIKLDLRQMRRGGMDWVDLA
jgi:hypothetical protein